MMRSRLHSTACSIVTSLVAMAFASTSRAATQEGAPTDRTRRTAQVGIITVPITVDGVLDEEVWRSTPGIGELVQRQPVPGASPSERTEVRLLRDRDNLFIGVIAYDSEPESVLGAQLARDGNLNSDDRIEILLDTFRDQRSAFYFATNPAGALVDGLTYANGELNTDWDTTWDVRTRRTETGWTAEFLIPFKSLSFPAEGRVWGFNFSRNIYRRLEELRWSGARLETQFLQVSEAGEIGPFEGLSQGIGLEFRPFFTGRSLRLAEATDTDLSTELGLDVSYRITPCLRLIGTLSTDFGENEVDLRQINLTRFWLLILGEAGLRPRGNEGVVSFKVLGLSTPGGIPANGADCLSVLQPLSRIAQRAKRCPSIREGSSRDGSVRLSSDCSPYAWATWRVSRRPPTFSSGGSSGTCWNSPTWG